MKNSVILAIETSCDDTSVAIVKNGKLLSNVTSSTIKQHSQHGGIVPEMAARGHELALAPCTKKAFKNAKIKIHALTHIAYASEPGLPGSLHVGKVFAKTLSMSLNIPLIPINHMLGHVFSAFINKDKSIKFPFISLVVSGGHTSIYLFKSLNKFTILDETTDDAVGEALDKIGRMLGLKYPGGVAIDKIYDESKSNFRLINHYQPEAPFSFSGIKTHILNLINSNKMKKAKTDKVLIASSALRWIVDELMIKLNYYSQKFHIKDIVIGGGVSANHKLQTAIKHAKFNSYIPDRQFTSDNAAMIAWYAYLIN